MGVQPKKANIAIKLSQLHFMNISYFTSFPQKGKPHIAASIISVTEFLNNVKYGKWQTQIENIRSEENKDKRSKMKCALPSVTISGTFTERKADALIEHSGFICMDIDGFNDKSVLLADPYTYALFRSASGNGIAVIVKINKEKHKESFRWLRNYYFNTYGIVVDPAPQNVASLRFASYDNETFINDKARQSKTIAEVERKPQSLPIVIGTDKVSEYVKEVVSKGINIAQNYDDYLKLGFALANGFGEEGREWFHALCCISEKYNSTHANRQYDICLKGASKNGVSVGTFYFMLKSCGIQITNESAKAVQLAAIAKKTGRSQEGIERQLIEIEGLLPEQAKAVASEVFSRDDISLKTVASDPERLIESLMEWLKQNHPIRKNSITKMIEENGNDVRRERLNSIFLRARSTFNTPNVNYDLVERIIFSDFVPEYNPLQEYIDKNRYRNTSGNIQQLINSIKTDTPNADKFIRKWLLSLCAAIDGYPVRSVLALVGGQNSGKTEWFRRLLPSKLKKYYAESKLDAGKDDDILMCQKLIVMDDEMGGKSKQDEKRFKELTSKSIFSLRAPYARANEDFKRLALLCGTSNDFEVINDPTGNTRILPVKVLSIDHELYNSIDKDELFMECVRAYDSGEDWQLSKDELFELAEVSNDFEGTNYEGELIAQFFKRPRLNDFAEFLTATEIKEVIESNSKQRIIYMKKFGMQLRNLFGNSISKKINGVPSKRYAVCRISTNLPTTAQYAENQDFPF
jgi:predicted P-loop ATPase